jgi:CTP:molybdopterin cytidylyltransferase MocA
MNTTPNIAILVMAAGLSRRMGHDKLLLQLPNGETILENRIRIAASTRYPVYVALPEQNFKRQSVVDINKATILQCQKSELGLGQSLAEASSKLPEGLDGVLVLLGDMPEITSDDIATICDEYHPDYIIRALGNNGNPGHPVLIPAVIAQKLVTLRGDTGAREILKTSRVKTVVIPNQNAFLDIDTEEDWKKYEEFLRRSI